MTLNIWASCCRVIRILSGKLTRQASVIGHVDPAEGLASQVGHVLVGCTYGRWEAPEDELRVGAEDILLHMCLVGYDEPEAAEEGGHGAGVGAAQEPGMDHAGGHDDHGAGGQ